MPPRQPPRPGLEIVVQAGEQWETEKCSDLLTAYGPDAIVGRVNQRNGKTTYRMTPLEDALCTVLKRPSPECFLLQAQFDVTGTMEECLGIAGLKTDYDLEYAELRPDIIQVWSPANSDRVDRCRILPDGTLTPLDAANMRLLLRVIDIKHTAEPSLGHFAEVAYYMMALAGWLQEHGFEDRFAVVEGAVWPGSHEASQLRKAHHEAREARHDLTLEELSAALDQDLERTASSVFTIRLRRFFQREIREVLSKSWHELPYHVSTHCSGCDYLGYQWPSGGKPTYDPAHCMQLARQQRHLSMIAGISTGASEALRNAGIESVDSLARVQPQDPVLDVHQTLKAKRVVMPARAQALQTDTPIIPSGAGTSSVMPKGSDLSIYVSADFDISSAITVALGLRAFWHEPVPFGASKANRQTRAWPGGKTRFGDVRAHTFIVDMRDLAAERRELLAFLSAIGSIMRDVTALDRAAELTSTMQVYLWDELQLRHLKRVIGRHLPAIMMEEPPISNLVWLFPPEDVLPSHEMQRRSPITVVKEAVTSLAALPIPHYYSLLRTARVYHRNGVDPKRFNVHPMFEDPLSDQIPSERAHEIWSRSTTPKRHWSQQLETYRETVERKLRALEEVTAKLQEDLRPRLQEQAPPVRIGPPRPESRISADGQLWYAFAKLDARLDEIGTLAVRAMPAEEREAKFHSAILTRRLTGSAEEAALAGLGVSRRPGRRVYELGPHSREVKVKEGDFLFALSPGANASFLNRSFWSVTQDQPDLQALGDDLIRRHSRMESVTGVTIVAIDRDDGLIVLDADSHNGADFITKLEGAGLADFSASASLDPVSRDFFTPKLKECLQSIGNPRVAGRDSQVLRAIGQARLRGARGTGHTPAADFLWDAGAMAETPAAILREALLSGRDSRSLDTIRWLLESRGVLLNDTQWEAWTASLSRRLQLIWGPPGTGKSRTVRAVILGAVESAIAAGASLRVLLCASTYTALDHVLVPTCKYLREWDLTRATVTKRLRSEFRESPTSQTPILGEIDLEVNRFHPSPDANEFRARLRSGKGVTLAAATPEQVYNLMKIGDVSQAPLFDLVVIDEASQMDVAHAILPLCALAKGGTLILAGDSRQLPPIHQAEPPVGLEARVGPIYTYMTEVHKVDQIMLDLSYRSNQTLVDFTVEAGYRRGLRSHSPELKLSLLPPPAERPLKDWPSDLFWTPLWEEMMDPGLPAVCFVYPDGKSSQWNDFEAETVGALIQTVYGRVMDALDNELDGLGRPLPASSKPYAPDEFWQQAIGVVTPHRAQQSRIISRLQRSFGVSGSAAGIRNAVDTVERFQGQQRDIIIASFALGDPDMIRDEDEFLMSLNRFNVMASRARAKLVVLVSQEVVDYLTNDAEVLWESRLLKTFVESFCKNARYETLAYYNSSHELITVPGTLRYR